MLTGLIAAALFTVQLMEQKKQSNLFTPET